MPDIPWPIEERLRKLERSQSSGTTTTATHTHAESDVTGLPSDLTAKAATANNLSDLASAATARTNLGLGTAATANKVAAGSAGVLDATDASTTNSRAPSGTAGGSLAGTFPNPTIAAGAITATEVAAANKDGVAGTASMRTLGTGATQATAGNDSRLSDSRAPNGTAGGDLTGTYPNPTLAAAGPGATGPIGSATVVPVVTIDAKGRTTALTSATIAITAANIADRTRSIWVLVRDMAPDTGSASSLGTAPDIMPTISCADAASQGAYFTLVMPKDTVTGAVNYAIYWAAGTTDAVAHTVRWSTDVAKIAAGGSVGAAGTTTAFTGASAARTTPNLVIEASQQLIASAAADDVIRVNIRRLGADAADTYVGVVHLVGVAVTYTADL